MVDLIAQNIIRRFGWEEERLCLLADEAYCELARSIERQHPDTKIRSLSSCTPEDPGGVFDLPRDAFGLLLAEPTFYVNHQLYRYLDFSLGEPRIGNTDSRVWIFPRDSLYRIFQEESENDLRKRDALMASLQPDRQYRITAPGGTELYFSARHWIPLDLEVCTAPVESSIHGVIVADGALFFRKIEDPLIFRIEGGKIRSIEAAGPQGEEALAAYRSMTAGDFQDPVNLQLAEIGIGFCHGAAVSDCFMEAEAAAGTCHFCFGNNVCYGGENESDFHGASVLIRDPVFTCL